MLKLRRLGLQKPKKEKTVKESNVTAQIKLMGLRKSEGKGSSQIKINNLGVSLLHLQKGDKVDILQREDGVFMIAKVTGEHEGRVLSANKNTETLSFTFSEAHKAMKGISNTFEISNEAYNFDNADKTGLNEEEIKELQNLLGGYTWNVLVPVSTPVADVTDTVGAASKPRTEEVVENKSTEPVAEDVKF